jgi:hypothetical protein
MSPNPHDNPDLYKFKLGGKTWIGEVALSGHDRNQSWDIQPAKGQDGASSSRSGEPIGQFEATFYITNGPDSPIDEFAAWDEYQALIESTTAGTTPIALPVYHPDLARNRFTAVVNGGVGGMQHDGLGGASVKVKFLEHRPPRKKPVAKAKAKGAAAGAAPGTAAAKSARERPDPNAAAKRELAALRAQARAP